MHKLGMAMMVSFAMPAAAQEQSAASSDANAGIGTMSVSTPAVVSNLHFMPNGAVLFHAGTGREDVPACAASQTTRWAIDANTAAGKAQLAGLLTAHAMGQAVQVFGTNTCTIWGDTESVNYLRVY